ncbi:MAG: PSD1 domain-containing protein [Fuerstia sp.]|nr:PSD1 domain-containing protein [Fuerstiella sp.]
MRFTLLILFLTASSATHAEEVNFNRDIKPILSQNCFQCHGPDDATRAAKLRLDQHDSATKPAESGATAIVAADPEHSELLARITSTDPDVHMPPAETKKILTAEQIDLLRRWIAEGAKYQGHWAFEKPVRPDLPTVNADHERRVANPIDRFIAARLEREGLRLSPEANRHTLIRRVSLDLTGLPPTPAEVDAFVSDTSPDAYEKVVDRLLMSPHYGERMTISWLDHARYADSNGFQSDGSRDIWAWREWVIRAYNKNMPFDQFTVEQLAGDMLPNATPDQIIATGFNRNHRLNGEGGRIEQEWFVETVIDRVETTGLTWLGLTVNCCRCHDHKYDPITQKEFYQLFAYFNSVEESGVLSPQGKKGENSPPLMTLVTPELESQQAALQAAVAAAEEQKKQAMPQLAALLTAWEERTKSESAQEQAVWKSAEPRSVNSLGGADFVRLNDASWLAKGKNPPNDEYRIEIPLTTSRLSGMLLETLPHAELPAQSLGRGFNGNFVLTGVSAELVVEGQAPIPIDVTRVESDYSQPNYTAAQIDLKPQSVGDRNRSRTGWAIDGNDPAKKVARRIFFAPAKPVEVPDGAVLVIRMTHDSQFADHNVGCVRFSISDADIDRVGLSKTGLPAEIQTVLNLAHGARTPAQAQQLETYFREQVDNPFRTAEAALKSAQAKLTDFKDGLPTTMVMKEGKPREAFVLTRGEYDRPADKVERAVPAFLPPLPPGVSNDRLGLAQWIVSDTNPLTARVWVNRAWERFFGTGIVKTSENFGSQADFPSHPELLDWLAVEFMQPTSLPAVNGVPAQAWDMKALQKLILMSATYRQSSAVPHDIVHRDPENRLLARGPRFRLSAEIIRDQALAVSGLLISKIGGESVRPYMPEGVWDETSKYGDLRGYKHDMGEGLYRRTMYTIWKRTAAPPSALLFDAPNREVCTIKRSRTNTPLQALALLNEVTFVEAARALAVRMMKEGGASREDRMAFGFRLTTGREPQPAEVEVLLQGWATDHDSFKAVPENAKQLLAVGDSKVPSDADPVELATWTVSANVLLNLDEVVTRE